ncbi:hypothetical protein [Pleurocapsa sp. PCC 7319]|uniref:hypothetical protein n=1 Tax=Pleurocapsa sp. PCC 7319 TaxID=118161 RepID=UPI0003477CFA|nr:hypothetical protein [Pleurocapsa sp. PCC 7319]
MHTSNSVKFESIERKLVLTLTIWAVTVSLLGYWGWFSQLPLPSIAFFVISAIGILLTIYYRHETFRAYISSIHPKHLTIFHLWRILAGFAFLYYGSQQLLPKQFVLNAGYGDLAVGILVPIVLMLPESTNKYIAFHIFSLLDFVLAVGTGLTFTLLSVPLIENIATFPIILIPFFGVPITGAGSVMAIDSLLRRSQ